MAAKLRFAMPVQLSHKTPSARRKEPERQPTGRLGAPRRQMRNQVRWMSYKETGRFGGY